MGLLTVISRSFHKQQIPLKPVESELFTLFLILIQLFKILIKKWNTQIKIKLRYFMPIRMVII